MIVSGENGDTSSRLPVPNANRLIVAGAHDPRVLVMELYGANVIEVSKESEQAPVKLVVPDLDFVIITSGDEEWLGEVEMDGADGAVVFVELVEEGAHAVIPELDDAAVETGEDPWPLRVEGEAFYSVSLRLEFRQHLLLLRVDVVATCICMCQFNNTMREDKEEGFCFYEIRSGWDPFISGLASLQSE